VIACMVVSWEIFQQKFPEIYSNFSRNFHKVFKCLKMLMNLVESGQIYVIGMKSEEEQFDDDAGCV